MGKLNFYQRTQGGRENQDGCLDRSSSNVDTVVFFGSKRFRHRQKKNIRIEGEDLSLVLEILVLEPDR